MLGVPFIFLKQYHQAYKGTFCISHPQQSIGDHCFRCVYNAAHGHYLLFANTPESVLLLVSNVEHNHSTLALLWSNMCVWQMMVIINKRIMEDYWLIELRKIPESWASKSYEYIWAWWHILLTPALWRQSLENLCEFKASLFFIDS